MKLIKLSSDHYIIVDDSEVMTHSTNVADQHNLDLLPLSLSEVKELLGEVDVEKKAIDYASTFVGEGSTADVDYKAGYNQALSDNKGKVYTEEDIIKVVRLSLEDAEKSVLWSKEYPQKLADKILQSIQPPTSWDVEFVDGKFKLI